MLRRNRFILASSIITLLLSVSLSSPAFADNPKWVENQLSDFKATAYQMRTEADVLKSYTLGKRLSWETHTRQLSILKNHVNQLGKNLADLESQKSVANENQVMAIEQVRSHLESIAQNLTFAIESVNENRPNVHSMEYAEAVDSLYAHADNLHTKVDTILDYDAARTRLDKLEPQSEANQGS
jgi:uncharacterized coiled-coil DUF342 family protein